MSKYVYLFELDSVRKTDEEIIAGQAALYDEIVTNGNIVVLTYNQMVDSRGFFSLLKNGEYKEALLKLFDSGVIRDIPVWRYTYCVPVFDGFDRG